MAHDGGDDLALALSATTPPRAPGAGRASLAPSGVDGSAASRFVRHAFVCTSGDSCGVDGPAAAIQGALKDRLRASGLKESLRVNKSGCLGQCGHGPMMVVYPEGVWYSHLRLEDVDRIWDEHLVGGRPVTDLQYETAAGGTNVVPNRSVRGEVRPPDNGPRSSPCSRCPA